MKPRQSKAIFITGGNGFIGSNLAKFLVKKGFHVHLLVRKKSNLSRLEDIFKNINIHYGEIENKKMLSNIIKKINPKYIYHLASYGNTSLENDLDKNIEVNILGLINLLKACENINYEALIISGSSSEYGFKDKEMSETDYLVPNSYYSATKGSATLLAQSYALLNNRPISIIRPFSVYGPFEEENRLIPTIIRKALKKEKIFITKGNIKRDFIYIDDVVNAFYQAAKKISNKGEIFNIGTGKQYTNEEIVSKIEKKLNIKLKIGTFPKKTWDTANWVANNSKAKKILAWKPKNSIDQGLKKTIEWYKNN